MRLIVLLLVLLLGSASSQEIDLNDGIRIIQTLSDPAQFIEYFPDTDRWIPWFGQRVREYKVPIILHNMGLMLLLVGLGLLIYQVLLGRRTGTDVLVRVVVVLVAWQLLVLKPNQNGCTPESQHRFPCTIEVRSTHVQRPVLATDGERYFVENRLVEVREPRAPELPAHALVKRLFRTMLAGANTAIIASLRKEGEGIKQAQQIIMNLSMISWSAAGAASVANSVPAVLRCAVGGVAGGLNAGNIDAAVMACAAGAGAAPEIARSVSSTMATARSLLIMGPMLVIATFHAINTIAGLYLYSLLFLMPLLVPLALIAGTKILGNAAKYGLVAIITPLFTGVLLATGMSLSYSYSAGRMGDLKSMAAEMEEAGIPVGASGFAIKNNNIASLQLYNLYQCLDAAAQNTQATLGEVRAEALCDRSVQSAVADEFQQIVSENYQNRNLDGLTATGHTLRNVILGQAFRRVVEQATPTFSPGGLWSTRSADDQTVMLADLRKLFGGGQGSGLTGNTEAMLNFFRRHRAFPDLGFPPGRAVSLMMAADGMTTQQAAQVELGLAAVAFNAASLPPNSFLQAGDTWANGVSTLGLMNRIHAAQAANNNFQNVLISTLRSKMLNLVILTLVAVGITIVMLGMATQMLAAFFGAMVSAGSSGLQQFMGASAATAGAGSALGRISRPGGAQSTSSAPSGGITAPGAGPSYPAPSSQGASRPTAASNLASNYPSYRQSPHVPHKNRP